MLKEIRQLIKGEKSVKDIWHFLVGNYRYAFYYAETKPLRCIIREHIRKQIEYRISVMRDECFDSGTCIKCGCETTQLQMANKSCEGNCYPKMLNKLGYNTLFKNKLILAENKSEVIWIYDDSQNKYVLIEEMK